MWRRLRRSGPPLPQATARSTARPCERSLPVPQVLLVASADTRCPLRKALSARLANDRPAGGYLRPPAYRRGTRNLELRGGLIDLKAVLGSRATSCLPFPIWTSIPPTGQAGRRAADIPAQLHVAPYEPPRQPARDVGENRYNFARWTPSPPFRPPPVKPRSAARASACSMGRF